MNFDIKDVKSWYNRHDVKVGDEGYFADEIEELKTENRTRMIAEILDNHAFCFRTPTNRYSFFLPLEAVKEDKPKEKKYRPFKTISELEYALNKDNRSAHQFLCVGTDIFIRNKNTNQVTHLMITRIDRDAETSEALFVNGMSPIHLFNNYEIRVGAEWLPFGVEVEND